MPKQLPIKTAEKFYLANQGGGVSEEVIKQFLKDRRAIVFGARSVNQHLPAHLDKHTVDYDILTPNDPIRVANEMEKSLDKRFGGNFFFVEPALHPGTFKVKSVVTGTTVADISGLTEFIPNVNIKGINYSTLDHQVRQIKRSLADPQSSFRHAKDAESLQRINIFRENNPTYYVSDLDEILSDDFRVKVVRRDNELVFAEPITKEQSAEISGFIKTFYPQLIFAKSDGKAVLRERAGRKRGLIGRRKIGG